MLNFPDSIVHTSQTYFVYRNGGTVPITMDSQLLDVECNLFLSYRVYLSEIRSYSTCHRYIASDHTMKLLWR